MSGQIVTFYSYKGGVGRSFALANIAAILADWGYKVLCVDFDLEAPGLVHYFRPFLRELPRRGIIDIISGGPRRASLLDGDYLVDVNFNPRVSVKLMAAGAHDEQYASHVQRLNWDKLYEEQNLGADLNEMRRRWKSEFDLVLIDGRTGITAFSGIFTAQLPDTLLFLFTPNNQSLDGCIQVVRRAQEVRNRLPFDYGQFLCLPVPARFEATEEYNRKEQWKSIFVTKLHDFTDAWVHKTVDFPKLIDALTIPYFPYWSFGEDIAALKETPGTSGVRGTRVISYTFETIAALIANGMDKTDLLERSRDEYVQSAKRAVDRRGSRFDVFLSYTQENKKIAATVARDLESQGKAVWWDQQILQDQYSLDEKIATALNRADTMVVVVGSRIGKFQEEEVHRFMRESHADGRNRKVYVFTTGPASEQALRGTSLMSFKSIDVGRDIKQGISALVGWL